MTQHASNSNKPNGASATEDLLNANVLPHLPQPEMKVSYLSHLVGLLLNYLFLPAARHSLQYDKDHMGIRNLFFFVMDSGPQTKEWMFVALCCLT